MTTYPYESQWGDLSCNAPLIERGESPAERFVWRMEAYPSEVDYLSWSWHACGLAVGAAGVDPVGRRPAAARADHAGRRARRPHPRRRRARRAVLPAVRGVGARRLRDRGGRAPAGRRARAARRGGEGRVVLASVSSEIRYPERPATRRGGHLVLVHAFDGETATFHNPSGIGSTAADARLGVEDFARFSAERGVTLVRPG